MSSKTRMMISAALICDPCLRDGSGGLQVEELPEPVERVGARPGRATEQESALEPVR